MITSELVINQYLDILICTFSVLCCAMFTLLAAQTIALKLSIKYAGIKAIYPTAVIGVPIHEFSHALMALLFRHNIRSIVLFKPEPAKGTLGYVEHQYNNTMFQRIGCFFIGIAPLAGGCIALYLNNALLYPELNDHLFSSLDTDREFDNFLNLFKSILIYIPYDLDFILSNFELKHVVWLGLGAAIALHMSPSSADFKNSVPGLICVLLCTFLFSLISIKHTYEYSELLRLFLHDASRLLLVATLLCGLPILAISALALFNLVRERKPKNH